MKHSVEIHPTDSLCYGGFGQFIMHWYYIWIEGKESPIIFKEGQKISGSLVGKFAFIENAVLGRLISDLFI